MTIQSSLAPGRPWAPAGALLLGMALAAASGADPEALPLAIDSPQEGHVLVSAVPWIEVRGRTGTGGRHYLAIAMDFSGSTYQPTGFDIDGDGRTSAARIRRSHRYKGPERRISAVEGDSILAAEMSAVRGLLEGLPEEDTQVAIVQFARRTRVVAELSSPREVLDALEKLRLVRWPDFTDLQEGLEKSLALLEDGTGYQPAIDRRSILVVTDGWPGRPLDREEATPVANRLAEAGARVHILVIQTEGGPEHWESVGEIASHTGGGVHVLRDPRDLPTLIQRPEFAGIDKLEVRNVTTGIAARGVRLYPNGDWDAFVKLSPGTNELRVDATAGGSAATRVRRVEYRAGSATGIAAAGAGSDASLAPSSPEAVDLGRGTLERLRLRTLQTELFLQAHRPEATGGTRKELVIEARDAD